MTFSTFAENNQLLQGILYDRIQEHTTFSHVHSVFTDEWYNFIVPKVVPADLAWQEVARVIAQEQQQGYSLMYYVPEPLYQDYKSYFLAQGKENESESDFYIFATNRQTENVAGTLIPLTQETLEEFVRMDIECFPDWDNSENYCRYFFELQNSAPPNLVQNFLYQVGGKVVGFCGIVASREHNLAYLHNTGILLEFRRQGHFSHMVQHLMNLALEQGVEESFALVDHGGASFLALQKLGFETRFKYFQFEV